MKTLTEFIDDLRKSVKPARIRHPDRTFESNTDWEKWVKKQPNPLVCVAYYTIEEVKLPNMTWEVKAFLIDDGQAFDAERTLVEAARKVIATDVLGLAIIPDPCWNAFVTLKLSVFGRRNL